MSDTAPPRGSLFPPPREETAIPPPPPAMQASSSAPLPPPPARDALVTAETINRVVQSTIAKHLGNQHMPYALARMLAVAEIDLVGELMRAFGKS